MIRATVAALLLLVTACAGPPPKPATPALWKATGPNGEEAWLFGTIHALPEPLDWQSPKLAAAIKHADRLVVEIAALSDTKAIAEIKLRLATTRGLPPLDARVPPEQRAALNALLGRTGLAATKFGSIETWAAALALVNAASPEQDSGLGVDRELLRLFEGRPIVELEGAEAQLRIFDTLPEADQRDLLVAVVGEAKTDRSGDLAHAWATGDMASIGAETSRGILADPELRTALLIGRNRAWVDQIVVLLGQGAHPLIAVGAAHMAGTEGLPVLLAARGFTVTRVQ